MNKKFEQETQQTVGSYGLFNSYNAVGGNTKTFRIMHFSIIVMQMDGLKTAAITRTQAMVLLPINSVVSFL
jgi:hypothetical protein